MEPDQRGDCSSTEDRQLEGLVRDDELDKELQFHLAERVADLCRNDRNSVVQRGSPNQFTFGLGARYSFTMHPLW